MKLIDVIGAKSVVHHIVGKAKEDVIKELLGVLEEGGQVSSEAHTKVYRALLARERIGTTGIGNGVAVPHAKVEEVDGPVGVLGTIDGTVDFASLDGEPVDVVMLFLMPKDKPEVHLEVMKHVSQLIRGTPFCQYARAAKDLKALVELIKDAEDL